jgi:uncharacterized phage-associated protein
MDLIMEISMATAKDIAAYILKNTGPIPAMKLQKLVYYTQAWSLVWDEKPLFPEKIEAWANGPVVPDLYAAHRLQFLVENIQGGNPAALNQNEKETVDGVLGFYGDKNAQWLSDLTHTEDPWKNARAGIPDSERSNVEITHAAMHEYYSSLRNS